jgi:hypothetical protein
VTSVAAEGRAQPARDWEAALVEMRASVITQGDGTERVAAGAHELESDDVDAFARGDRPVEPGALRREAQERPVLRLFSIGGV